MYSELYFLKVKKAPTRLAIKKMQHPIISMLRMQGTTTNAEISHIADRLFLVSFFIVR